MAISVRLPWKRAHHINHPISQVREHCSGEVTKNVLEKAPCSVGLLIDKRIIMNWRLDSHSKIKFHVCVVFVGGPDSREALAYGIRMNQDIEYREVIVKDGAETSQVLLAIDNHYDFMLVGRRLDSDCRW
ncbi:Cation/H(+) antiporter 15 [Camellia lanceoleosa]|nr:Cation/H(+) antiporter 15 [Camellia lanceoleosa]